MYFYLPGNFRLLGVLFTLLTLGTIYFVLQKDYHLVLYSLLSIVMIIILTITIYLCILIQYGTVKDSDSTWQPFPYCEKRKIQQQKKTTITTKKQQQQQ